MPSTLPAEKVTLYDLEQRFQLQRSEDAQFFLEWQQDLLPLTEVEQ
jgi:hypothetical protein